MSDQVTSRQDELLLERDRVSVRYARLDALRREKEEQLARVRRTGLQGSLQNHSERDAFASLYVDRLAQLYAVDDRLVFGRLDMDCAAADPEDSDDDGQRYIGRIGLTDEDRGRLLVDWRAAEAGAFYQATALQRQGVRRRRHLMLRGRDVQDLEDEILDPGMLEAGEATGGSQGALLAAVTARRTGRMTDIVATIQSEQDALIRGRLPGAVVIQGGPGTGKTAVALHRAAYLLYTHRERLAKSGVLIVGPSDGFMRYIERVLPALGETGVVMRSLGSLFPGVQAAEEADPRVAELKGRLDSAQIVANAVAQRQRLIPAARKLTVDGTTLKLKPGKVRKARDKARATGKKHNKARNTFVKILVRELADQLKERLEKSAGTSVNRDYLIDDVRSSRDVRVALNLCWMPMTPERLVEDLFTKEATLRAAAPWLTDDEVRLLLREPGSAWTEADVPLLDEAAELLGPMPDAGHAVTSQSQHDRNLDNARATLENVHQSLSDMGVDGIVDAEMLAAANEPARVRRSTAEQAGQDRTWTFGHVVVDEAQELSPMQWRLLARRCPLKSFTIVGDIAQASALGAARSWEDSLSPVFGDQWRQESLTVNYRSPARIMRWAARVARAAGLDVRQPEAVREGEHEPRLVCRPGAALPDLVVEQLDELRAIAPQGLAAVIVPASQAAETLCVLRGLYGSLVDTAPAAGVEIVVATPRQTKGLEFDTVVLAAPERIVSESHGVMGDLYVSMTRCTHALRVVSTAAPDDLPGGLTDRP